MVKLAPKHVVILPIFRKDEDKTPVLDYCTKLADELRAQPYFDGTVQVELDDRDLRGGEKTWQHIKRGVPIRLEIGPRDLESDAVFMGRRDLPPKEKASVPRAEFVANAGKILDEIQDTLFRRAVEYRDANTCTIDDRKEFEAYFTPKNPDDPEFHGGFALCHFAEDPAVEEVLKDLKVTIRCIPREGSGEPGTCLFTGKPSTKRAVFAKAY